MKLDLSPDEAAALFGPSLDQGAGVVAAALAQAAGRLAADAAEGWMDKDGAAKYLGIEVRALENWMKPLHEGGRGLPHMKVGATVRFRRSRIDAWGLTMEVNAPQLTLLERDAA